MPQAQQFRHSCWARAALKMTFVKTLEGVDQHGGVWPCLCVCFFKAIESLKKTFDSESESPFTVTTVPLLRSILLVPSPKLPPIDTVPDPSWPMDIWTFENCYRFGIPRSFISGVFEKSDSDLLPSCVLSALLCASILYGSISICRARSFKGFSNRIISLRLADLLIR